MKVQVLIRLKSGVLDVQGKAVEHGITELGVKGVTGVSLGKLIEFDVDARSAAEAQAITKNLCEKLLANTIIENYEIVVGQQEKKAA